MAQYVIGGERGHQNGADGRVGGGGVGAGADSTGGTDVGLVAQRHDGPPAHDVVRSLRGCVQDGDFPVFPKVGGRGPERGIGEQPRERRAFDRWVGNGGCDRERAVRAVVAVGQQGQVKHGGGCERHQSWYCTRMAPTPTFLMEIGRRLR